MEPQAPKRQQQCGQLGEGTDQASLWVRGPGHEAVCSVLLFVWRMSQTFSWKPSDGCRPLSLGWVHFSLCPEEHLE